MWACDLLLHSRFPLRSGDGFLGGHPAAVLDRGRIILLVLAIARPKIFPFPPTIKVDKGLHAAPFHDFAFQPNVGNGLYHAISQQLFDTLCTRIDR